MKLSVIGRIGRTFGNDGTVTVNIHDPEFDRPDTGEPLFVIIDGLAVPLFSEEYKRRGRSSATVRFADIDTPQRAEEFAGLDLMTARQGSGQEEASELADALIGYRAKVRTEGGSGLLSATVTDLIDSDMNPLIVLEMDSQEIYVPFVEENIEFIDTEARLIGLTVPEGLLDLNA